MINKENKIRQIDFENKLEKRRNSPLISESYPNVETIEINMLLDYPNAFSEHKKRDSKTFLPTDKAYFEISCINKDCVFSDLKLDSEIHNTIFKKLESFKNKKNCNGYNTFSCYERKLGTCMTSLEFEVKIKYKSTL